MGKNRESISTSLPPLYLAVGDNVRLVFEEPTKPSEDRESRLVSICITMNKLAEIIKNGPYTKENIWDVQVVKLITKTNFFTKVNIPKKKRALIINSSEELSVNLICRKEVKCKNIFEQPRFTFFVHPDQNIRKKDVFSYSSKQLG